MKSQFLYLSVSCARQAYRGIPQVWELENYGALRQTQKPEPSENGPNVKFEVEWLQEHVPVSRNVKKKLFWKYNNKKPRDWGKRWVVPDNLASTVLYDSYLICLAYNNTLTDASGPPKRPNTPLYSLIEHWIIDKNVAPLLEMPVDSQEDATFRS